MLAIKNNKLLLRDNKLALHERCCCHDPATCCQGTMPVTFNAEILNTLTDTGDEWFTYNGVMTFGAFFFGGYGWAGNKTVTQFLPFGGSYEVEVGPYAICNGGYMIFWWGSQIANYLGSARIWSCSPFFAFEQGNFSIYGGGVFIPGGTPINFSITCNG